MPDDDPLARTATAPGSEPQAGAAAPLGDTLGRYKLQRELGAGGMGVVHAALDPDLERRVALKVLRGSESPEARQRLLREARAMARLSHPNVVTVHEVGSANGRDYVAMELVDGGTLEDWLRAEPRSRREILGAFIAAGRGLAAAHAAGLVHRDFKPRNVLRANGGRIVVTDFGLVLGVGVATADDASPRRSHTALPATSQLSGLTATGSVLGTPAYMAPEQWEGGAIGPPADQFAFCVALWEALAGERPYRGETLEELHAALGKGPAALDDSRIPRRLRRVLRRGLATDPAQRYASMDALLVDLARADRTPAIMIAIAGAALVAAGVGVFVATRSADGPTCEPPDKDPAVVWPSPPPPALAGQRATIALIDADLASWRTVRERACKLEEAARQARFACLDAVLARVDAVSRAMVAVGGARRLPAAEELVDPTLCELPRPPRLMRVASPEVVEVLTAYLRAASTRIPLKEADANALLERVAREPCAAAAARMLAAGTRTSPVARNADLDEAEREAQRCGDDRLLADVALAAARYSILEGTLDVRMRTKVRRAEVAVEVVPQRDLQAQIETIRAWIAHRGDNLDEAIARAESAMKLYEARGRLAAQISSGMEMLAYRELRARPDELAKAPTTLAAWRAKAASELGENDAVVHALEQQIAWWLFSSGDVAAAHAKLAAIDDVVPTHEPMRLTGRVVDEGGQPVAGATVATAPALFGHSVAAWVPSSVVRTVTTGADGRFVIEDAPTGGGVIAQLDDRRSAPLAVAADVTLALAPTSRLEGKVDLRGELPQTVTVMVRDLAQPSALPYWGLRAPVKADGSFSLAGVPRGRVLVQTHVARATTAVVAGQQVTVEKPVETVQLAVQVSKRSVHVIVRSTVSQPIATAQVLVMPGVVPSTNLKALEDVLASANVKSAQPIIGENAPPVVIAKAKPGDVYATVPAVPEGAISACALGMPPIEHFDEHLDKQLEKPENRARVEIPCVPLGPTDEVVIVAVPPWPRFD